MGIGIRPIDQKRKAALETVELLDVDPMSDITDEQFLTRFTKLQVVVAELFAREEEVIRLIGMPDSEKRRHIMEHDKLLDLFNDIYMKSMDHRKLTAREVYTLFRAAVLDHINGCDVKMRQYVGIPTAE